MVLFWRSNFEGRSTSIWFSLVVLVCEVEIELQGFQLSTFFLSTKVPSLKLRYSFWKLVVGRRSFPFWVAAHLQGRTLSLCGGVHFLLWIIRFHHLNGWIGLLVWWFNSRTQRIEHWPKTLMFLKRRVPLKRWKQTSVFLLRFWNDIYNHLGCPPAR